MLILKDYIAFAFSIAALCLSLYNLYRSRQDARAANVRTIEQRRSECMRLASDAKASALRNEATLDAVRFEALRARDTDLVRDLDAQLTTNKASIALISEMQDQGLLEAAVEGTHEELATIEKLVSSMTQLRNRAAEDEQRTANLAATARQKLIAAKFLASAPGPLA